MKSSSRSRSKNKCRRNESGMTEEVKERYAPEMYVLIPSITCLNLDYNRGENCAEGQSCVRICCNVKAEKKYSRKKLKEKEAEEEEEKEKEKNQ